MLDFLFGIFVAKTVLSDNTVEQNQGRDPGQVESEQKLASVQWRLTDAEVERQARENRRKSRNIGIFSIFAVPLVFVVTSTLGGFMITTSSCSHEEVCLKKNLHGNIEAFGQHHILAIRKPLKTMQLIQPKYYIPYGLGLFATYGMLFAAVLNILCFLIGGMSYAGGRILPMLIRRSFGESDQ